MNAKPSALAIIGVVVGLVAYGALGYFLLVSPQRGKAADMKKETASIRQQIGQYRALSAQAKATPPIRVAELFRLTKAMPDEIDMSGVVLELSRIARNSGIEFDSISPQGAAPVTGYSSFAISLEFDGNYYELSDFLFRLRNLVRVRSGQLDAQGRLFVVDSLSFGESTHSFPRIKASLSVRAFVYGDVSTPTAPVATPPSTTTTGTTTTPASPNATPEGASATPVVP